MSKPLTQEEIDALPNGTMVVVSIGSWELTPVCLGAYWRTRIADVKGAFVDATVRVAPPTEDELAAALLEMYALTDDDRPGCCVSLEKFKQCRERAADLIQRMGK